MKTILCILSVTIASNVFAFEIISRDGIPTTNKYYLGDRPIWTDVERDTLIAQSSGTLSEQDFVSVVLTQNEQNILDDLQTEKKGSRDYYIKGLSERNTKDYILNKKLIPLQRDKEAALSLSKETGIDVSQSTAAIKVDIDKYSNQYEAATK